MILYKKKQRLAEIDINRPRIHLLGLTYPLLHFMSNASLRQAAFPFQRAQARLVASIARAVRVIVRSQCSYQASAEALQRPACDGPKLLLLAAAVPMHWIVLRLLEPTAEGRWLRSPC